MCVVNRNKEESILTDIISQSGVLGNFRVFEVNGADIKSENNFDKEEVFTKEKPPVKPDGNKFIYSFPPQSFTMMKGKIVK